MGLIVRILVGIFCGFSSHLIFHKPTARFGSRWGALMRYAIGYTFVIPLRQLFMDNDEKRVSERVLNADILSGFSFGAGVLFGYLSDSDD